MNRLILPGLIPSVNHQYENKTIKGRRMRVLTLDAAKWEHDTILLAKHWRQKNKWSTATGKIILRLWYYFPDARQRDTHNTLKLLLDALESAGIYENDRFALPQIMNWEIDRQNPRTEIEFEVMQHA